MRRVPVIATVIVLIAVAVMIRLGLWQIDRMQEKEALLARYGQARTLSAQVPFPRDEAARQAALYRQSTVACARIMALEPRAGRNDRGAAGWAHVVRCALPEGGTADISIGWTSDPSSVRLRGGAVEIDMGARFVPPRFTVSAPTDFRGILAPAGKDSVRLVAIPPAVGLGGNAVPDPAEIANNHWSYAIQWFLFAGVALVIYGLALRARMRK